MKYPIERGLQCAAKNIPFSPVLCRLSQKLHEKLHRPFAAPEGVTVTMETFHGFQGLPFEVMVITPEGRMPSSPAILDLHGGAFGYKAAEYQLTYACKYAKETGCIVFFPDYHLLPDYPHPAAYEDAMAVYREISAERNRWGVRPDRILVVGDSAGGALAAGVCNHAEKEGLPAPCFQMLIYPVLDCRMETESMRNFPDTPVWNAKNNRKMWELYLKDVPLEQWMEASPMQNELPMRLPATYIETTEFDCLHDEAIAYARRIRPLAKSVTVEQTIGTMHGYDMVTDSPMVREQVQVRIDALKRASRH